MAWRPSSIGVGFLFLPVSRTLCLAGTEGTVQAALCGNSRNRPTCSQTAAVTGCEVRPRRPPGSLSEAQPPLDFVCGRLCPTVAIAHLSLLLLLPFLPAQHSALAAVLVLLPLSLKAPQLLSRPPSSQSASPSARRPFPSVYPCRCKFGPTF